MSITKIAIACYKHDQHLLRPCVASIRYWYPKVEILLIKDVSQGHFSTRELEETFNVKIFNSQHKEFGWGWGKFALLLHPEKEKFLFLDSDVVFVGPVLDVLNRYSDDFIVTGMAEVGEDSRAVKNHYLDVKELKRFDPSYEFPGFVFNTGQIVLSGGLLTAEDFEPVAEFKPAFRSKRPDLFKHADQGLLNYALIKASQTGQAHLRYVDFWIWGGTDEALEINLQLIKEGKGQPYILHWAGPKPADIRKLVRYDILRFFENIYYSKLKNGKKRQKREDLKRLMIAKIKIFKYTLFRQN